MTASRTPPDVSNGRLEWLKARHALLERRCMISGTIGVVLLLTFSLLSTRTVERLLPDNFPDWASATLVLGTLGGSMVSIFLAGLFMKMGIHTKRELAQHQHQNR